jgi:hypothetical protein
VICGGLVPPILTLSRSTGARLCDPDADRHDVRLINLVVALPLGPETKDVEMVRDLVVA